MKLRIAIVISCLLITPALAAQHTRDHVAAAVHQRTQLVLLHPGNEPAPQRALHTDDDHVDLYIDRIFTHFYGFYWRHPNFHLRVYFNHHGW